MNVKPDLKYLEVLRVLHTPCCLRHTFGAITILTEDCVIHTNKHTTWIGSGKETTFNITGMSASE